ncbi:MAG: histidine triad nucleotide-binding protein [Myxococcales bacterium]
MDCIFCKIVAGEIPAKKVGESAHAVAFPDINPVAPQHVLVIPKRHIASLNDVTDWSVMAHVYELAGKVARETGIDKTGWRAVINTGRDANQLVHHIHLHVVGGRQMEWPPG